jgi:hypothetical protein
MSLHREEDVEQNNANLRLPQRDGWHLWKCICRSVDFDDLLEGNESVGTDKWHDIAAEIGLDAERAEAAANDPVGVGFAVLREGGLFLTDYGIGMYHNVIRLGGSR